MSSRNIWLGATLLLLGACKHPLAIVGEGDIIETQVGERGCTLEEFQAQDIRCTDNQAVGGNYNLTYKAVPREGMVFKGWSGTACGPDSVEPDCTYSVGAATLAVVNASFPDIEFPPLTATFVEDPFPVFEADIAGAVINTTTCLACHFNGGVAGPGSQSNLQFDRQPSGQQNRNNYEAILEFVDITPNAVNLILTNVRGGNAHTGGVQFTQNSQQYRDLEAFLELVEDLVE